MASMNAFTDPVKAFQTSPFHSRSLSLLQAVPSPDMLQAVQPKSTSSRKKREEVMKAMNKGKVEDALDGVDAQMLELLSDQFLYPSKESVETPTTRPRGRPEFVPGAMKYETMMKYREDAAAKQQISAQMKEAIQETPSIEKASRKKSGSVKGSSASSEKKGPTDSSSIQASTKKRKRVVKNLPEPRDPTKQARDGRNMSKGRSKVNNLELQKYYRTELLTADEEYSLGVKIQLMVKCEQVHEGLALEHMRLPTIEEWATACG